MEHETTEHPRPLNDYKTYHNIIIILSVTAGKKNFIAQRDRKTQRRKPFFSFNFSTRIAIIINYWKSRVHTRCTYNIIMVNMHDVYAA